MLPIICKLLMKFTGNKEKEYFDIFEVQLSLGFITWGEPFLVCFTDSDWSGDPDDRKSTAGCVFSLGSRPVTWFCKKQQALALSSAEEKYRAIVNASQEALWLRQILS